MTKPAFGFRDAGGANPNIAAIQCIASSSDSNPLGIGDAVVLTGSTSGGSNIGKGPFAPYVTRAAATGNLFGFVISVDQLSASPPNLARRYRPASTKMYVTVLPFVPNHLYAIRANAALSAADVGANANLATITDCNTTTGQSNMQLDQGTVATSQTAYQMTIFGIEDDGVNVITATNPVLLVQINNIQAFPGFGGV